LPSDRSDRRQPEAHSIGIEAARQQVVDRDVGDGDLAGKHANKAGEAGTDADGQ
jgi:hypothetical protein